MRIRKFLLVVLVWLAVWAPVQAAPQTDILIVVDTRVAGQKALEHELREVFSAARVQKGISSETLPIDTYDVSQAGHRVAAERLHIQPASMPFLAVAQLDARGIPAHVLIGVDRVENAKDGLARLDARYQEIASRTRNASPITGRWKQYAFAPGSGEQVYLLTMQVAKLGDAYHYTIEDVSPRSVVQKIHIFNTVVDGDAWEFDSDWGDMGIAHFILHREAAERYIGWSYLNGERHERQLWIRTP